MSVTPRELEALMPHVANAEGHTVIAGLGLGIALYNVLSKPGVNRVSLLENDDSVIDWFEGQDTADWKGIEKLEIVRGDARETKILSLVDFLYVDIWNVLGAEEALEDTIAIQKNIKAGKVGYWGQELDFICWLGERGSKLPPTEQQYDAWMKSVGMPLIKEEYHWLRAVDAATNICT